MRKRRRFAGLRQVPSDRLHAMAGQLRCIMWERDVSEAQERLWDAIVRELEYRYRRPGQFGRRCICPLCRPPFPDEPLYGPEATDLAG